MYHAPKRLGEPTTVCHRLMLGLPFPDWEDEFLSAGSEGEEEDE